MTVDPNELLLDALVSHGFDARLEDGWIATSASKTVLRGLAFDRSEQPEGKVAQLDVFVGLPDGRLLVESTGGGGPSFDEAIEACFAKFVRGSFHPILGAFLAHHEHQEVERWTIRGVDYDVLLGPFVIESSPDLKLVVPPLADRLKEVVTSRREARRAHWCRVFYSQLDKKPLESEALWDNERSPELEKTLAGAGWPSLDGFYAARLFFVLTPVGDEASIGPSYCELERSVELLVQTCATNALDDEPLRRKLVESGIDSKLAARLVTFGPLGFSAVLLHGCKLGDHYDVYTGSTIVERKRFVDEPVFVAARDVAWRLAQRPEDREQFLSVAMRCARAKAANAALLAGSKLEDLEVAAVVSLEDSPEPRARREAREPWRSAPKPAGGAPRPPEQKGKPWWKPW